MKQTLKSETILALAMTLLGGVPALAQHDGHQSAASAGVAAPVGSQAVSGCPESAQSALPTLNSMQARLEQARQANSAAELRTAMDGLRSALDGVSAQVNACARAGGSEVQSMDHSTMDHSKMDHSQMGQEMDQSMEASQDIDPVCAARADSKTAPQVTYQGQTYYFCSETNRQMFLADPARYVKKPGAETQPSKMPMGGATAATPGAALSTKPAAPMGPMDHSKMPMGREAQPGKVMDPVSGLMVDPATAPKTTYQGQTYYFSSEQTRKEFLENPAKFATKPKK